MTWLVLGVLSWSAVHLFPCSATSARSRLIDRLGEQAYRGLFALAILVSIVVMALGWRASAPAIVYLPPAWGALAANVLVFIALVLFAASGVASNLKRLVRHPQLTGVLVWSGAHLLSNGEDRSLVLFGGLGLWAIVAITLINRRDGAWEKPER